LNIRLFLNIYTIDKTKLNLNTFKTDRLIGTPRDNEYFLSKLYQIQLDQFHVGNLNNLLKMIKKGRIILFMFERSPTMTYIQKFKIKKFSVNISSFRIYYQMKLLEYQIKRIWAKTNMNRLSFRKNPRSFKPKDRGFFYELKT